MQIFVLEGELTIATELDTQMLAAGQSGLILQGVSHSKTISGPESTRYLAVASPSGFAQFVRTMGIFAEAGSLPPTVNPNFSVLSRAAAEVGDELPEPPTTSSKFGKRRLPNTLTYSDRLTMDCLQEVMPDYAAY